MKYGLTRKIDVYDYEKEAEESIIAPASSWFKAMDWLDDHKDELEGRDITGPYEDYVWAYFGLKDANRADKYGLSEPKSLDDVVEMASKLAVSVAPVPDDSLPLAKRPKKS